MKIKGLLPSSFGAGARGEPLDELDDHAVGVGDLDEAFAPGLFVQLHGDLDALGAQPLLLVVDPVPVKARIRPAARWSRGAAAEGEGFVGAGGGDVRGHRCPGARTGCR
ncbi:hypothetical protein [Streptomyces flaveolus]|uniref:hypothetical protein n=1 Tax=Streptomyces flaveolus TaxID=67297 RepID=UPI003F4DFC8E